MLIPVSLMSIWIIDHSIKVGIKSHLKTWQIYKAAEYSRKAFDLLEGLEPGILHDGTRGEAESIGVSQEVSRDRGTTFLLGDGPLCTKTFPASPTRSWVSLEEDKGSLSHCLWEPMTSTVVMALGSNPLRGRQKKEGAVCNVAASVPNMGTSRHFFFFCKSRHLNIFFKENGSRQLWATVSPLIVNMRWHQYDQ